MRRLVIVLSQRNPSQSEIYAGLAALPDDVETVLVSAVDVEDTLATTVSRLVLLGGAKVHATDSTKAANATKPSTVRSLPAQPSLGTVGADATRPQVPSSQRHAVARPLLPRLARAGVRLLRRGFLKFGGRFARGIVKQLASVRVCGLVWTNPAVVASVRTCDVVCAADAQSVMTVWSLARKFTEPKALLGLAAANYVLNREPGR